MTRKQRRLYLQLLCADAYEMVKEGIDNLSYALEILNRAKGLVGEEEDENFLDIFNHALHNINQCLNIFPEPELIATVVMDYMAIFADPDDYAGFMQILNEIIDGGCVAFPLQWEPNECSGCEHCMPDKLDMPEIELTKETDA